MREVAPGDVIFSFCDTRILAIGVAVSFAYECPKPAEFGAAGPNWSRIGWKVEVRFTRLNSRIRPKEHIDVLRSLLPVAIPRSRVTGTGCSRCTLQR